MRCAGCGKAFVHPTQQAANTVTSCSSAPARLPAIHTALRLSRTLALTRFPPSQALRRHKAKSKDPRCNAGAGGFEGPSLRLCGGASAASVLIERSPRASPRASPRRHRARRAIVRALDRSPPRAFGRCATRRHRVPRVQATCATRARRVVRFVSARSSRPSRARRRFGESLAGFWVDGLRPPRGRLGFSGSGFRRWPTACLNTCRARGVRAHMDIRARPVRGLRFRVMTRKFSPSSRSDMWHNRMRLSVVL